MDPNKDMNVITIHVDCYRYFAQCDLMEFTIIGEKDLAGVQAYFDSDEHFVNKIYCHTFINQGHRKDYIVEQRIFKTGWDFIDYAKEFFKKN